MKANPSKQSFPRSVAVLLFVFRNIRKCFGQRCLTSTQYRIVRSRITISGNMKHASSLRFRIAWSSVTFLKRIPASSLRLSFLFFRFLRCLCAINWRNYKNTNYNENDNSHFLLFLCCKPKLFNEKQKMKFKNELSKRFLKWVIWFGIAVPYLW